jgi:hypothetical protein
MKTLSMFEAMRRKSTLVPSSFTRKIASPCAGESAGVAPPGAGVKTSSSPRR